MSLCNHTAPREPLKVCPTIIYDTTPRFLFYWRRWGCSALSVSNVLVQPLVQQRERQPIDLVGESVWHFGVSRLITRIEFKEIRKEWKARKKEEENARKADEERQRQAVQAAAAQNGDPQGPDGPPSSNYPGSRPVTLPPIGYQPAAYPAPPSGSVPQQYMPEHQNHMYSNYPPPQSPYGQPNQGMYNQCKLKLQMVDNR